MYKLISFGYYHHDMVKCSRNINLNEMDTQPSTVKNDDYCGNF